LFQKLTNKGFYTPRPTLINGLLTFDADDDWETGCMFSHYTAFFRLLSWALRCNPGHVDANHLIQALQLVAGDGHLPGFVGIVILLLYHGSKIAYGVKTGANKTNFVGLRDHAFEAECWRRWIAVGHIGGLPPEIAEMMMLSYLEDDSENV
jgi:hypothetical protein